MTRLIAHRALFDGPNPALENNPYQIERALSHGFDAEIDVWRIEDRWMLGHDAGLYEVNDLFFNQPNLWCHAKNLDALEAMVRRGVHCFWHDTDAFTLTSRGFIWAYPGQPLVERSVWVQPEWAEDWRERLDTTCHAICSKHVAEIRSLIR